MSGKNEELGLKTRIFSKKNPLIIAEIGTGHNGDIGKAKALIDAAFEAGASAVKFQIVYAEEILHPATGSVDLPTGKIELYKRFKELEVQAEFYKELSVYAKNKNLLFSATPFGLRSCRELIALEPDFIKIASPELNYMQLLKYAAGFNLPLILSTGVSLLCDIEKALLTVREAAPDLPLAVLHCVTAYPAPESDYNLSLIKNLAALFNVPAGLSDHSMDPVLVPLLSLSQGAFIIEKHICLSRKENGLDDPVALEPVMFKQMCAAVKKCSAYTSGEIIDYLYRLGYREEKIRAVIGSGEKKLGEAEKENYGKTNRSLHYVKALKKGSVITRADIAVLRTEKNLMPGEEPEKANFFVGAVLQKDVSAGSGVLTEDFIQR